MEEQQVISAEMAIKKRMLSEATHESAALPDGVGQLLGVGDAISTGAGLRPALKATS